MNANIHRFGFSVAVSVGNGSTTYLTPKEARALSRALRAYANDVDTTPYQQSELNGESIAIANGGQPIRQFYLQHGSGDGPFRNESVPATEEGGPQKRRGSVTATRFTIRWEGRNYRVYSDSAMKLCHFILSKGERIPVTGVSP